MNYRDELMQYLNKSIEKLVSLFDSEGNILTYNGDILTDFYEYVFLIGEDNLKQISSRIRKYISSTDEIINYISQLRAMIQNGNGELIFDRRFLELDMKLVNLLNNSQQCGMKVETYWKEYLDISILMEKQTAKVIEQRKKTCRLEGKILKKELISRNENDK